MTSACHKSMYKNSVKQLGSTHGDRPVPSDELEAVAGDYPSQTCGPSSPGGPAATSYRGP